MFKSCNSRYDMLACAAMLSLVLFMPYEVLAANFNELLCNTVGLINTQAGQAIATGAVLILGVGAILGRIQWGQAILFGAGIAAIFGSTAILSAIGVTGCASLGGSSTGTTNYVYFFVVR